MEKAGFMTYAAASHQGANCTDELTNHNLAAHTTDKDADRELLIGFVH